MLNLNSIDIHDGPVMMRFELLAAGYDGSAIARMRRAGALHRLRHGAYVEGALWRSLNAAGRRRLVARATLRSARSPAVLAGPSAADELQAPVWDMGDAVHITRLDGRAGRREAGVVQHRGSMRAGDLTIRDGIPLTSGTRTAVDMIAITEPEHALVTINGLVRAGETSVELMEQRLAGMKAHPFSLNAPIVLSLVEPRCESAGETRTLMLCWRHHLPRPIPQYEVRDAAGRLVARVDFAWPDLGVFLEFDGKEKYQRYRRPGESVSDMVLREKERERVVCGITGWRCIRIVWADLLHPQRTAGRIRSTLAGQPWAA
ncbi:type IV toxin-antitoxin system AbiEi family antitoxin domain-containing protein [Nocardioides soli]|uniref:Type IV toxin-antitoxin system AbiEi family antitoxin domain-containing protein n=1 Tax=Nocardioides soli TaxID=1036020 RepID=A0A7W4VTA1_9ACTN|nr:type IV toxin-antitoxin system AbiEi family antitoxin domain-containing protein [Nocardioides soli]MBB3041348.1 hypothetical protein [Nocardioides soli]